MSMWRQVIGLAAFLVASGFFAVFSMGVDAIFMSFRKWIHDCISID